jgi:hypothetical protein
VLDAGRSAVLADRLGLRLETVQPCALCLFAVGTELARGDERKLRAALRFFTPLLWEEGLEAPLREALARAARTGVADADTALADVERHGSASPVVEAVVCDLAAQQRADLWRLVPPGGGAARWN